MEKWISLGTLTQEPARKPVQCERVLQTSLGLMTDGMEAQLSGAADFQISDTVRCFRRT